MPGAGHRAAQVVGLDERLRLHVAQDAERLAGGAARHAALRELYGGRQVRGLQSRLRRTDEPRQRPLLSAAELGNSPRKLEHDYAGVFFELVARRYRRGSFVIATNLGFDEWPSALGSPSQVTPASTA